MLDLLTVCRNWDRMLLLEDKWTIDHEHNACLKPVAFGGKRPKKEQSNFWEEVVGGPKRERKGSLLIRDSLAPDNCQFSWAKGSSGGPGSPWVERGVLCNERVVEGQSGCSSKGSSFYCKWSSSNRRMNWDPIYRLDFLPPSVPGRTLNVSDQWWQLWKHQRDTCRLDRGRKIAFKIFFLLNRF